MPSGLLSAHFEYIGNLTTGSFTQSGGTNSVSGVIYFGIHAGRSGTYGLSGSGLLSRQASIHRRLRKRQFHAVGRNQYCGHAGSCPSWQFRGNL